MLRNLLRYLISCCCFPGHLLGPGDFLPCSLSMGLLPVLDRLHVRVSGQGVPVRLSASAKGTSGHFRSAQEVRRGNLQLSVGMPTIDVKKISQLLNCEAFFFYIN